MVDELREFAEMIINEGPDQVKAVLILDNNGAVLAHAVNRLFEVDAFDDVVFVAPKFVSSLKVLSSTLPVGSTRYLLVEGSVGIVQLINLDNVGYVMVVTESEESIGLIRLILRGHEDELKSRISRVVKWSEDVGVVVEVIGGSEITPKDLEDVINFLRSKLVP
jgi:predicted regulator of Ras-like GTPase activity (Roadblock/LC7/MglB family)